MRKILSIILLCLTFGINTYVHAQCNGNAPIINTFSPNTGFIGSTVTITGANFDPTPANNQVFFGATKATVLTASFGVLTVQVPVGASTAPIAVKNGCNLIAYSSVSFNGIFCPTPITSTTYANTAFELFGVNGAYNMLAQDMDLDGKPDVVSAYNGLTVARNTSMPGTLSFTAYNFGNGGNYNSFISTADFDGDGKRDLFGTHNIYHNTSSGPGNINFNIYNFQSITGAPTGYQNGVGDFNNDGKIDVVMENAAGTMYFYRNTSSGPGNISFAFAGSVYVTYRCTGIQCVDADGDGKTDVLATQGDGNRAIALHNTTGAGNTSFSFDPIQAFNSGGLYPYRCQIADFDKDGKIDLATVNYNSPLNTVNTAIFRNTSTVGSINFATPNTYSGPNNNYRLGVGDVNGDGLPDIVTKSLAVQAFAVYPNTSSGAGNISFAPRFDYSSAATAEVSGIVIGDLDGDFVPDIATSGVNSNTIRFHRNTSAQTDNTPPTALCKNITVALSPSGTVTVTPQMIDNGSGDACGIGSLQINNSASITFTCANIGDNTVTLKVTDKAGNVSTCTCTVTVAPAAIIVSGQTTVCQGQTVTMNANQGDSYQWYKDGVLIAGATSQTYIASVSGNYTVTVTNSGGCSGTSAPTAVTVNNNPTVSTSPSGNASLCPPNGTVTLSATLSSIYQWKLNGNNISGATQQTYTANAAGSYSVQVIDLFGCTATSSPIIVSATDNIAPVVSNCPDNITVDAGSNCSQTVSWTAPTATDNCGNVTVTSSHQPGTAFALGTTTVTYTFKDASNNSSTCSFTVTVIDNTPPAITCPASVSVNNDPNVCGAVVNYAMPTATENCVGAPGSETFSYAGNIVTWTVPAGVNTVTITAKGAQGGTASGFGPTYTGGKGASITGTVAVTPGQVLKILVGGAGTSNGCLATGGGGGGSFVVVSGSNTPLVIAGGGGGATINQNGIDGTTSNNGTVDGGGLGFGGTAGSGGRPCSITWWPNGGGGGGLTGNAPNVVSQNVTTFGGISFINGGAAVAGGGGFGGGGGVGSCTVGGGGGGGYSGGAGGMHSFSSYGNIEFCVINNTRYGGGGGGSYNAGSSQVNIAGSNSGNGQVTLSWNSGAIITQTTGLPSGSVFPIGTTTNTFVASDAAGNTSTCSFNVTVTDVQPPTISCPGNISVTGTSAAGAVVNYATPVGSDNCPGAITELIEGFPSGSTFPLGTTTVTYKVTDAAGLTAQCSFTVSVVGLPPSIVCPGNIIVNNDPGQCGAVVNFSATETTGIPASTITYSHQPGSSFPVGTTTVTATATNAVGTSSCTFTVTVKDVTPPVIACPFDIVVNATAGTCGAVVNYNQPSATDNCGGGILPTSIPGYTYKGTFGGHTYFVSNNLAVPETAHANAIALGGHLATINSASENTFVSNMRPGERMWIGFTDRDVEGTYRWVTNEPIVYTNWSAGEPNNCCGGPGEDWAVINWSGPTWNDWFYDQPAYYVVEFEGGNIPTTLVSGPASGSEFPVGTTIVTWSATDNGGNTVTCSFTVTVNDVEKPQLNGVPANVTVECDAVPARAIVTASDNCPGVGNVNFTEQRINGNCPNNYRLIRTWSVTDAHGNSTSAVQIVTVQDTQAPAMTAASDMTVECDGSGNTAALNAWLASHGGATAMDACGNVSWSNNFSGLSDGCGRTGSATVTFVAKDDCGNSSSKTATFTIVDTQAPSVTAAADMTVECDGSGNPTALNAWLATHGGATASDICSGVSWSNDFAGLSDGCGNTGRATVTFTATDECGNRSSTTATFTIVDNTPPAISCPADATVNCQDDTSPAAVGSATASDVCSGVTITSSDVSTQSADVNNAAHYNYTITRTWKAVDECGNASECVQTITVHDVTAPSISCPADVTINCQDDNTSAATGSATATDNCSPVAITESQTSTQSADINNAAHYNYVITRTWRATDVSGNFSECVQTITVHDVTNPVISCPANVTVNCQDDNTSAATGVATGSDICSPVTITESDASTQNSNPNNAGHYNYKITRTWKATDVSGNATTCVQTIKVQDVTAPTAKCKNVTITLVNGSASITPAMVDGGSYDNCSPLTLSVSKSGFHCSDIGANTVTLTVKDVTGNTSTCTATVTVVGEIPTCSITSVPSNNTYTGGVPTTLYLGYGAQSTTLQLSVPASGAPYSFQWSGNGTLSSTTVQSPVFAPTAAGNYTFTVFITNKYGCTTTCTISICVMDIRVLNNNGSWDGKKVYICHIPPGNPGNAQTLEVSVNAVPAHIGPLGHATDRLGKCTQVPCTAPVSKATTTAEPSIASNVRVLAHPNPNTGVFKLQLENFSKGDVQVQIVDNYGKLVADKKFTVSHSTETVTMDITRQASGVYFARVIGTDGVKTVRVVVAR